MRTGRYTRTSTRPRAALNENSERLQVHYHRAPPAISAGQAGPSRQFDLLPTRYLPARLSSANLTLVKSTSAGPPCHWVGASIRDVPRFVARIERPSRAYASPGAAAIDASPLALLFWLPFVSYVSVPRWPYHPLVKLRGVGLRTLKSPAVGYKQGGLPVHELEPTVTSGCGALVQPANSSRNGEATGNVALVRPCTPRSPSSRGSPDLYKHPPYYYMFKPAYATNSKKPYHALLIFSFYPSPPLYGVHTSSCLTSFSDLPAKVLVPRFCSGVVRVFVVLRRNGA